MNPVTIFALLILAFMAIALGALAVFIPHRLHEASKTPGQREYERNLSEWYGGH